MKKGLKIHFFGEYADRIRRMAIVLAVLLFVCFPGKNKVWPAFIQQDSWHLISAEAIEEGVLVKTAGENLMLHKGVGISADSEESEAFAVEYVRDGIIDEKDMRWSSVNDWENCNHWIEVRFPQTVQIGLVRLYWERANAQNYALEYSENGKHWTAAAVYEESPESLCQDLILEKPVSAQYLRLHVTDVTRNEADLSLYYQNISLLEMEVYEGIEAEFLIQKPVLDDSSDRVLQIPEVPEGFGLEFVGADYEMLISADGTAEDTIADVLVELGFALTGDGARRELPGMSVVLPANTVLPMNAVQPNVSGTTAKLPEEFAVMEWQGGNDELHLDGRVYLMNGQETDELQRIGELFKKDMSEALNDEGIGDCATGENIQEKDAQYISLSTDAAKCETTVGIAPIGEEGYMICIDSSADSVVRIFANTAQGLRYGCADFCRLTELTGGILPEGVIRDYPRYSVRGFGVDVGRRPITMDFLYQLVEEMSRQKMNMLLVHLNDNQIISTSDYDGTMEGAYGLYAGFRLESDLKNESGEGITSEDLYYTKEEFAQFIADAKAYGVNVIPEIDTPAHSLALTKCFPKLGLSGDPEGADQLDLSNSDAVQLGLDLWSEYLAYNQDNNETEITGTLKAVFEECEGVHIGMDEYFGDKNAYMEYLEKVTNHIQNLAPEKEIYLWGSLSKMSEDVSEVSRDLRMHIWDVDWADPQDMYEEGFSIVNSLSSSLYIIPGGGYDRLDQEYLEENWQPNIFETAERTWKLPAYSERMLGACYMMWNDWSHLNGESITEDDLFERFANPLPVIAQKLWGY